MSLQSAWNQALSSVARAKIGKKLYSELPSVKAAREEDKQIKLAEEEQAYREAEAQKKGYKDAQTRFEVETAAEQAAQKLKQADPNFGFYVATEKEVPKSAFGEGDPSGRYIKGSLEQKEKEAQQSLNKAFVSKMKKQALEERKMILDPSKNMDFTYRKTKVNMEEENNGK